MPSDNVIETRELTKTYRRSTRPAVDALNLTVKRGQVFGFLGPNGAGKTTTIGMLLGNIFPTSGDGTILGRPIGDREARRRIGYLPEKFQFHDFLTATEFLDLHGRLYGMSKSERRQRIPMVLERVGLADRAASRIGTFSKGMQQRVGLAQAIIHQPELVILDEPTSALDPLGRRAVRELVVYLRDQGTTVLLNSHLLSEIERTCDEIAIVRAGKVVRQGTVAEITTPASSVIIELESVTTRLEKVADLFGETVTSADSPQLTVSLKSEAITPDLVEALIATGGRVRAVTPVRESLEDAFVRVVGETTE